jgi:hypothetical protein
VVIFKNLSRKIRNLKIIRYFAKSKSFIHLCRLKEPVVDFYGGCGGMTPSTTTMLAPTQPNSIGSQQQVFIVFFNL